MIKNLIDFRLTPKLGHVITLDAQRYVLIDTRLHRRLDGEYTMILTWQSDCAACGNPFTTTSGLVAHTVNRRCATHKRPGISAKTGRCGRPSYRKGGHHD